MARYAMRRGLGGFLLDGCVRDREELRRLPFPVYARGVTPNGSYKFGPGEINVPVAVGGQVICPGDILVGDGDGVVVVRPQDAAGVAAAARAQQQKEALNLREIEEDRFDRAWVAKALADKGCESRPGADKCVLD